MSGRFVSASAWLSAGSCLSTGWLVTGAATSITGLGSRGFATVRWFVIVQASICACFLVVLSRWYRGAEPRDRAHPLILLFATGLVLLGSNGLVLLVAVGDAFPGSGATIRLSAATGVAASAGLLVAPLGPRFFGEPSPEVAWRLTLEPRIALGAVLIDVLVAPTFFIGIGSIAVQGKHRVGSSVTRPGFEFVVLATMLSGVLLGWAAGRAGVGGGHLRSSSEVRASAAAAMAVAAAVAAWGVAAESGAIAAEALGAPGFRGLYLLMVIASATAGTLSDGAMRGVPPRPPGRDGVRGLG